MQHGSSPGLVSLLLLYALDSPSLPLIVSSRACALASVSWPSSLVFSLFLALLRGAWCLKGPRGRLLSPKGWTERGVFCASGESTAGRLALGPGDSVSVNRREGGGGGDAPSGPSSTSLLRRFLYCARAKLTLFALLFLSYMLSYMDCLLRSFLSSLSNTTQHHPTPRPASAPLHAPLLCSLPDNVSRSFSFLPTIISALL